jgi:hypothetical protein
VKISKSYWLFLIAVIIAAWPLFFLNIVNQLDWGDDNCKYLEQAQQLANGQFNLKTKYIFNEAYFLGPKQYPNGYPLLLAAWSKLTNFSVLSFNYLNVFLLMLIGGCVFTFARQFMSNLSAFVLCILFYYHPAIIAIKQEVLSEFAYLALSLIVLILLPKRQWWAFIIGGLLLGFTVHVRSIGFCILIVFGIYYLIEFLKTKEQAEKQTILKAIGVYGLSFLSMFCAIKWSFPSSSNYHFFNLNYNVFQKLFSHFGENFFYFTDTFFALKTKEIQFLTLMTGATFLFAAVYGWFLALLKTKENSYLHYYVAIYFLTICFFKHGNAGFRFIIPIFPFLLIYAVLTLKQLTTPFTSVSRSIWQIGICMVLLIQFVGQYPTALNAYTKPINGPNDPSAIGVFEYIKKHTTINDRIAFEKPRALSYFTDRYSLFMGRFTSTFEMDKKVKKYHFNYFVFYWDLTTMHDLKILQANKKNWKVVYQNKKAMIFKKLN